MSAPSNIKFVQLSDQILSVNITDQHGTPLMGLTVTATLLDSTNTPVPNFNNLNLSDAGGGNYSVQISHAFDPAVNYNYTCNLVITDGTNVRDVFIPAQVVVDTGQ